MCFVSLNGPRGVTNAPITEVSLRNRQIPPLAVVETLMHVPGTDWQIDSRRSPEGGKVVLDAALAFLMEHIR